MDTIAFLINEVISNNSNETVISGVKEKVKQLCSNFPLFAVNK